MRGAAPAALPARLSGQKVVYPVYLTSFSQEVLMSARGINKVILVGVRR
ncbi:hypothetical protein G3Z23_003060 [Salmonella enterica subsp. enterica serovar Derby]|nr:hypothetical protein [Salmonella enterica subsp. enterica serovar Derby]